MPTFGMLEIGKSALVAATRSMDVTSHNIANASSPGFSRQDAVLEPIAQAKAYLSGAGVRVSEVRRASDAFVDSVLRGEMARAASFLAESDVFDHLQTAAREPSDHGPRAALDAFWSSWQDLTGDPGSLSARAQLVERGRSLAEMFCHLGSQIDSIVSDVDQGIETAVARANELSSAIADMNLQIARAVARDELAADLMDRRDLAIDELASLTGATVTKRSEDGTVRVAVSGFPLVERYTTFELGIGTSPTGGTEFRWFSAPGSYEALDGMGGRLQGLRTSRDEHALGFKQELEALYRSIVDEVNALHMGGITASQAVPVGVPFFLVPSPETSYLAGVTVNPDIVADLSLIAADGAGPEGAGAVALAIATRLVDPPSSGGVGCIESWAAMIGTLGAKAEEVKMGYGTQELLVKGLENKRDSIKGVSLDEELVILIHQQHAFGAASRVITVADEVLDTIINRMGAGR